MEKRNKILDSESIHEMVLTTFRQHISDLVNSHLAPEGRLVENDYTEILEFANNNLIKNDIELDSINGKQPEEVIDTIAKQVISEFESKLEELPEEVSKKIERLHNNNLHKDIILK